MFTSRSYAIGMAHFQVAGGLKILALLAGAYALGASLLVGLVAYSSGWPIDPRVATGLMTFVLVMEALIFVGIGALRVGGCIRADTASNMIESHRLMPIASWRAVAGYLLGTTLQTMVVTLLNL